MYVGRRLHALGRGYEHAGIRDAHLQVEEAEIEDSWE